MSLRKGAITYEEWTRYEIVWYQDEKVYVWDYDYTGPELDSKVLPEEVNDLYFFISQQQIPVMVYRLPQMPGKDSFCSHSNAAMFDGIPAFACTGGWMAMNGFHPWLESRIKERNARREKNKRAEVESTERAQMGQLG
jgi:hypothetical protein